jgi:hypothetical protein
MYRDQIAFFNKEIEQSLTMSDFDKAVKLRDQRQELERLDRRIQVTP